MEIILVTYYNRYEQKWALRNPFIHKHMSYAQKCIYAFKGISD